MDLIRLSIRRPIFITMVTLFLVILGVLSLTRLPVDLYPDVSYPVLAVRVGLPGAAPQEVEELITKPLEDVLSTIAGVENLRSISREGNAIVVMEFSMDTDIRFQEIQVRAKVSNMERAFPEDASEPVIYRQDPDDTPVIELAVTGDRTAAELTQIVEDEIANRLRRVSGVGEVDLGGGRQREILVELRREVLEAHAIDTQQVVRAIQSFNRNDPLGKLEGQGKVWVLRSLSQSSNVLDLGEITVARLADGTPLLLKDVAKITQGFEEETRINRFGDRERRRPAVLLDVLKQSGQNTVEVSNRVRAAVEEIKTHLPPDMDIIITRDNADLVRANVADVYETLIIGAILTVVVVLFFLHSPRSTLTTGLALPTSVLTTFAAMAMFGFSVNVMTLLGLSLAIGLLIDDAIVVRENIFRHLQTSDAPASEAAYHGTRQVILAVMGTSLTIVAVFLPVGFMGGVSGQFFQQFALTVVFAVAIATWDALTMAPMLSTYFANFRDTKSEWVAFGKPGLAIHAMLEKVEHGFERFALRYKRFLEWLLPRPWVAAGVTVLTAVATVYSFMAVKKSFLPSQLGNTFSVNMSGPMAVPMSEVIAVADESEERLAKIPSVKYWTMRAGAGFNGSAYVRFTIEVTEDAAKNQETLAAVREEVRRALLGMPGYAVRISEPADPMAGGSGRFQPVAVMIAGDDLDKILELGRTVRLLMLETEGVSDVREIEQEGLPEVRVRTIPQLAAFYGVTPQAIGETLRTWVEGNTSNSLRVGDDQIPIRVRLEGGNKMAPGDLLAGGIVPQGGAKRDALVPISNVVEWEAAAGPPVIVRENRQRILRVGANLEHGAALGNVVASLREKLRGLPLESGYSVEIVGQNEQMDELFGNIIGAIVLGSIFVYMILASLFESLLQPITIMAAIPLAGIGAAVALIAAGMPLDLYAGIGMVLLCGLVAKNSILLVDFALQRVRDEGADPRIAVLETAPLRLRPILMTSIAMIAGMLPVATGLGASGASRMGLGIATIGGIVSSTFLTLVIVPNLFLVISKVDRLVFKRKKRSEPAPA